MTTDNGTGPDNKIVIDPEVYAALLRYHDRLAGILAAEREAAIKSANAGTT